MRRDDELPRVPGAAGPGRAATKKDDFFFTMLVMAVFLPAILIAFATLGTAIFTVNNIFMIIILLGMFLVYNYHKEYHSR